MKNNTNKNLILTISLGNRKQIFKYSKDSITNYAKKYEYDLIIVDDFSKFKKNLCDVRFLKLSIIEYYLDFYDRIILFDDTCIIHPDTIDLFKLVPSDKFGAYIESNDFDRVGGLGEFGKNAIKKCCEYYSNFDKPLEYSDNFIMINTGVMVVSKNHKSLFNMENYKLKYLSFGDQCFMCYKINKNKTDIFDLEPKYNTVGSLLVQNIDNLDKIIYNNNYKIFHVTRGARNHRIKILKYIYEKIIMHAQIQCK